MITTPQIESRRKHLSKNIDLKTKSGLEIGAYDRPIVLKSDGNIKYLDYYTAEELRKKAAAGRDSSEIVEVDYVLHGRRIPEVVTEKFDYIVASHVVEHVPNIVGWLKELASILKDGGEVFLAVPDKRYTFDFLRPLSTTGMLIENYRNNKTMPSFADVFDVLRYHKKVKILQIWNGKFDVDSVPFSFDFDHCLRQAKNAMTTYFPGHCNVFTCESFLQIMNDLIEMAFIPFTIEVVRKNEKPFNDFFCILKKSETTLSR